MTELRDKIADIVNDHAPVQPIRHLPNVECATPACNFRGEFQAHARHVADLILKVIER